MIEVEIEDSAWLAAVPDAGSVAEAAAKAALEAADADGAGGVAVLLTGDARVRELNARYRAQDKPTNVLSFPAGPNPHGHLGDVALAFGICAAEAEAQGKALERHLQHLVAHGVLHLVGYDHESDTEAEAMETLERTILAGLGAPDPYAAEKDAPSGHG